MAEPAVSVLLPVRDAAATLHACLRSLQRQTLSAWECVLVDDGSRDGTHEVAAAWARRDSRLRVMRSGGRGVVAALQAGLGECRAPLVARMDADDVMHRRRLELQARAVARQPELAAVGCHPRLFPSRSAGPGLRDYADWLRSMQTAEDVRRDAYVECPIAHPTWMLRRDIAVRHGYRDRGWPEDYDLLLRLLQHGFEIGVVPRRLLAWRRRPGSLSAVDPRYGRAAFTACKAAFLAEGFLAGHERFHLWGYGHTGRALCRALERHGRLPGAIVELHPGRLGNTIRGAEVVAPEALPELPPRPLIVSVAGAGPRAEIRAACRRMGLLELRDFVCAA